MQRCECFFRGKVNCCDGSTRVIRAGSTGVRGEFIFKIRTSSLWIPKRRASVCPAACGEHRPARVGMGGNDFDEHKAPFFSSAGSCRSIFCRPGCGCFKTGSGFPKREARIRLFQGWTVVRSAVGQEKKEPQSRAVAGLGQWCFNEVVLTQRPGSQRFSWSSRRTTSYAACGIRNVMPHLVLCRMVYHLPGFAGMNRSPMRHKTARVD